MKVLVIEDLPVMVAAIQVCFSIRWPDTIWVSAENGRDGLWLVESEAPDIIILDLGLPDMDGLEVLREIRKFSDLPVIIVTVSDEVATRVTGLELGADDYVVKPFSHIELLARAKAVLRRTHMPELKGDEGVVSGGGLSIDLAALRVLVEGQEINLTPTEWKLLSYLVRNEGRIASRQVLAERVWGTRFLNASTLKMCARRLRLKLGDNPQEPNIIRTHRGMGYSFARPN